MNKYSKLLFIIFFFSISNTFVKGQDYNDYFAFIEWQEKNIKYDDAIISIEGYVEEIKNQDYKKASDLYHKAIRKGDSFFAPYRLACMFIHEQYHKYDVDSIVYYTKMAAYTGNAMAESDVGVCYEYGYLKYPKDLAESLAWYRKSASKGYSNAQYSIGVRYYLGNGIEQNIDEALKWFKLAAEKGHADSAANCSYILQSIEGAESDAAHYKELAAKLGSAEAQYLLGLDFLEGWATFPKDEEQGIKWIKMSADQGNTKALIKLNELGNNY